MRAKNGSIIGKRNWWTTSKHKHTKRRCGTRRPVSCVSLLQRSPGTRYCGNERASAVRAGLYILNKKKCVRACLWGCTRMPAGGREVSEEAFRKALIAVPLFSPAVTPSSALRLSSLITHTGNTTLIRDSTTSPNHTLTRLWPKCQNVHTGVFVCVCVFKAGNWESIYSFSNKRWKSSSLDQPSTDARQEQKQHPRGCVHLFSTDVCDSNGAMLNLHIFIYTALQRLIVKLQSIFSSHIYWWMCILCVCTLCTQQRTKKKC